MRGHGRRLGVQFGQLDHWERNYHHHPVYTSVAPVLLELMPIPRKHSMYTNVHMCLYLSLHALHITCTVPVVLQTYIHMVHIELTPLGTLEGN